MSDAAVITVGTLQGRGIGHTLVGSADEVVRGVHHDSREIQSGDLFAAISGAQHDGEKFVPQAIDRGAAAVLAERELTVSVPVLVSTDVRHDLAVAAELVYGEPTSSMTTIGITGTNGKTTTAHLVETLIRHSGGRTALMGTTGNRIGETSEEALHTTPEGDDISRFARRALNAGCTHLVMEVSSHGLALHRVDGVTFGVAVFTNLSQDHLDFHGTLEEYGKAKVRLFTELAPEVAVLNIDDEWGRRISEIFSGRQISCSTRETSSADVHVMSATFDHRGTVATLRTPSGRLELESPLVGGHNLENLVLTVGCAEALGIPSLQVKEALSQAEGSPGRLERVSVNDEPSVFVDYAHTPDALVRVLAALRPLTAGRLIVVFGAGGDRDRSKRPAMSEAAVQGADIVVVTSDNPRNEPARQILRELEEGALRTGGVSVLEAHLRGGGVGVTSVEDRKAAIELAIAIAQPGDTVLVAGKGHETTQIVGDRRLPFDDRVEARRALDQQKRKA